MTDHEIDVEVAKIAKEDGWALPDANLIEFGRKVWLRRLGASAQQGPKVCKHCNGPIGACRHFMPHLQESCLGYVHTLTKLHNCEAGKPLPMAELAAQQEPARQWNFPTDEPVEAPKIISFGRQLLTISANPEDHDLPWGVTLEDRKTMFDVKHLSFNGFAEGRTNWTADNYWYPRMWIEIVGYLEIIGQSAHISTAQPFPAGASGVDVEGLARRVESIPCSHAGTCHGITCIAKTMRHAAAAEIRKHIAQPTPSEDTTNATD